MMKQFCELTIETKNNIPIGYISDTKQDIPPFDVRTILCDLRPNPKIFFQDLPDDFFFDDFDYGKEYAFNPQFPFKIRNQEREQYAAVVNTVLYFIRKSIKEQSPVNFNEVEFLKSYCDITFKFMATVQIANKLKPFIEEDTPAFYAPFLIYSHFSINDALNISPSSYSSVVYTCPTLSDLIFAILHYLALNNYKFSQCQHCKKFYATNTYKQKYCYRNSPFPKQHNNNCEQAVRDILQDLRRTRKAINKNLETNYPEKYDTFFEYSSDLISEVLKDPSLQNIEKAYKYINKEEQYTKSS